MAVTISRHSYANMYGPTTGDKVRLADTDLVIEVERDLCTYGDEVKFGGGKVIRDGMGQSQLSRAGGAVDTVITNALIVDHTGICKADVGLRDGLIVAIGKAVQSGSGWNDALIIANAYAIVTSDVRLIGTAYDADADTSAPEPGEVSSTLEGSSTLSDLNALALALCSGAERLRETTQLGQAFAKAASAYCQVQSSCLSLVAGDIALPVAIGVEGALAKIPLQNLLPASLQASSSNLVWIATRLVPLGQTEALRIISRLQPLVQATAHRAMNGSLDDIGSGALMADLASIEHEQLASRICIT